jgi:hypothetical protein
VFNTSLKMLRMTISPSQATFGQRTDNGTDTPQLALPAQPNYKQKHKFSSRKCNFWGLG